MRETGRDILDDFQPEFADNEQAALFHSQLVIFKVLSRQEGKLVNAEVLDANQFVEMFSALKNKQEDLVFPTIQKIFVKLRWRDPLISLQEKLRFAKMENYIVKDSDLLEHHELFKHSLPKTNMLFVGRHDELQKMQELINNCKTGKNKNKSSLIKLVVTGLGGVGKTQLVMQFIKEHQLEYDSVIWINAESFQTAETAFKGLAQKLEIFNKEMDTSTTVEAVYRMLRKQYSRNLIIFDNADDYIPEGFWFDELDNFVILVTPRNSDWNYFENKLDVNVFQPNEAAELVKKSLTVENYKSTDDIDRLIEKLAFFPLALQQAVAYIKQTHKQKKITSSSYKITDYLVEYFCQAKSLLNHQIRSEFNKKIDITMLNTWNITVSKLNTFRYDKRPASNVSKFSFPVKILHLISFGDGTRIDPFDLLHAADNDKSYLGWAICLLEQYSMVNTISTQEPEQRTLITVHKMVQEITIIRLKEENLYEEAFVSHCDVSLSNLLRINDEPDLMATKDGLLNCTFLMAALAPQMPEWAHNSLKAPEMLSLIAPEMHSRIVRQQQSLENSPQPVTEAASKVRESMLVALQLFEGLDSKTENLVINGVTVIDVSQDGPYGDMSKITERLQEVASGRSSSLPQVQVLPELPSEILTFTSELPKRLSCLCSFAQDSNSRLHIDGKSSAKLAEILDFRLSVSEFCKDFVNFTDATVASQLDNAINLLEFMIGTPSRLEQYWKTQINPF